MDVDELRLRGRYGVLSAEDEPWYRFAEDFSRHPFQGVPRERLLQLVIRNGLSNRIELPDGTSIALAPQPSFAHAKAQWTDAAWIVEVLLRVDLGRARRVGRP